MLRSCLPFVLALAMAPVWCADPDLSAQAQAEAGSGLAALRAAETDHAKIVEAALAYTRALKLYEQAGDVDKTCEMQANVFWCRKKMDVNDLKAFVAATSKPGNEAVVAKAVKEMEQVADHVVAISEAEIYFQRATTFAKANPEAPMQVAIRWFEVADRFKGTEWAQTANDRFLQAMLRYSKAADPTAAKTVAPSPFRKPVSASGTAKVPDEDAGRAAVGEVQKLWKDAYASSKPDDRRDLAEKLLREGRNSPRDHLGRWALLNEACRLAVEYDHWPVLVAACAQVATTFAGLDQATLMRTWLAKAGPKPVAQALLKLLDDPEHPASNQIVGTAYVLRCDDLEGGLPLWSRSPDAVQKRVAEQELAKPANGDEMAELGNGWWELSKRQQPIAERDVCLVRARLWLGQARNKVDGLAKDRVLAHLQDIDKIIPPPIDNWDAITPQQWDGLKARIVTIPNRGGTNDLAVAIPDGLWRLVPHPTEQWGFFAAAQVVQCDWRGTSPPRLRGGRFGFLILRVDNREIQPGAVVKGPVRLFGGSFIESVARHSTVKTTGAIRLKLVPATEADANRVTDPPAPR